MKWLINIFALIGFVYVAIIIYLNLSSLNTNKNQASKYWDLNANCEYLVLSNMYSKKFNVDVNHVITKCLNKEEKHELIVTFFESNVAKHIQKYPVYVRPGNENVIIRPFVIEIKSEKELQIYHQAGVAVPNGDMGRFILSSSIIEN